MYPLIKFKLKCDSIRFKKGSSFVTYDGCTVDTSNGAMDKKSGIFNTTQSGIYQISFTVKYVVSSSGQYGAWSDIMINDKVRIDDVP